MRNVTAQDAAGDSGKQERESGKQEQKPEAKGSAGPEQQVLGRARRLQRDG